MNDAERRIRAYEEMGDHRSGREADNHTTWWMTEELRNVGVQADSQTWRFPRVEIHDASDPLRPLGHPRRPHLRQRLHRPQRPQRHTAHGQRPRHRPLGVRPRRPGAHGGRHLLVFRARPAGRRRRDHHGHGRPGRSSCRAQRRAAHRPDRGAGAPGRSNRCRTTARRTSARRSP